MGPSESLRIGAFTEPTQAPPCVFVLFGATGDLAARKIAPALYNLRRDGLLSDKTVILGVARRPRSDEAFRDEMLQAIRAHSRNQPVDEALWRGFAASWHYHVTHAGEPREYATLADRLREFDRQRDTGGSALFYLAMTPDTWPDIIRNLSKTGLCRPRARGGFVRIIVEKPFGEDLDSARELSKRLLSVFDESQVYRIDHYLGKETVQNIFVFRFANSIFEPLLNRQYVARVQITTAEKVGMEGRRGPYYETVGALRDMVQNHMLQLLALIAMEVPLHLDGESIRDEKVKVLKAIRPLTPEQVAARTVRGQYTGGDGVSAYRRETGVAEDSTVETYAAVKLFLESWRWADVPFYLRTGKRLARKTSQILIEFKREPLRLFEESNCEFGGPNHLRLRITPDEGIALSFDAKVPGARMLLRPVKMDFHYDTSFESATPEAYEHLILDAMQGEPTPFIRSDEAEASWRFIDSIRSAWDITGRPSLIEYAPGTWGPEEANKLFDDPYEHWYPL